MRAARQWFVYILRCADGTLYTGITTDLARRIEAHNAGGRHGARYTLGRRPVALAYCETATDRSAATRREAALKRLSRAAKWALCAGADGLNSESLNG
ncbi:MAG: GIY-YIG nuclease family protein [Thiotrichales bacterium]